MCVCVFVCVYVRVFLRFACLCVCVFWVILCHLAPWMGVHVNVKKNTQQHAMEVLFNVQCRSEDTAISHVPYVKEIRKSHMAEDQQRVQPGKCLYCARAFWLYLQSHYRMRNVSLVGVLYAYNGHSTMALVPCVTSVAKKKNPDHPAHGNGHGHVRVYARLRHIKRAMHGPD